MKPISRLKELRKSKGMTIVELSEKSGVSKSAISIIENKTEKDISSTVLIKLSDALGCTIDYLVKGEDAPAGNYSNNLNEQSIVGNHNIYNEKGVVGNNNNFNCESVGIMKKLITDLEHSNKMVYKLQEDLIKAHKDHIDKVESLYEKLMEKRDHHS